MMLEKIKTINKEKIVAYFSDVRNIGLFIFVVISLLVTWSGIKVVQTNYDLQKQISQMQQQNEVKKLENSNLALRNQFLETDEYLELAARQQFNKAAPGEKLLIVPRAVAEKHIADVQSEFVEEIEPEEVGPWYERNFNAWLEFLLRRQS